MIYDHVWKIFHYLIIKSANAWIKREISDQLVKSHPTFHHYLKPLYSLNLEKEKFPKMDFGLCRVRAGVTDWKSETMLDRRLSA